MSSTKKYFWLKLKDDFFTQPKIKKLRRIAGGDTYTIIYLKMQLLSIKNEGRLFFEGTEDNFVDEIALCIDEEPENVSVTVNYLLRQGLLQQASEVEFSLPETMQSIGSETSGAERVRRFRERQSKEQKALPSGAESNQAKPKALQCNTGVTSCNTDIRDRERERERNRDRDRDRGREEHPDDARPASLPPVPYEKIKELYNSICVSLPKCTALSEARRKAIKARFGSGYTLEDFERVFRKAEASSFIRGANNRNWRATFDWLIKDTNIAKVLDGNYDDHEQEPYIQPQRQERSSNPFLELLRQEEEKARREQS